MLSQSSYLTALYCYTGGALGVVLVLGWWLSRYWRAIWVALVVLPLAALLLTPAHPGETSEGYAPALVVAVFEGLTKGPEAAQNALTLLGVMSGVAVLVAFGLGLTLFRKKELQAPEASAGSK